MTIVISIVAIVMSTISFILSYKHNRNINREASRYRKALFYFERNLAFEGRIAEMPEGLDFFGIDIASAKQEGITHKHIAFMLISLNAQWAYAYANNIGIYEHIKNNTYRQNFYAQDITRRTWKYVKPFFYSESNNGTVQGVSKYLEEMYPSEI